jgi:O-methyltransferase involved in polyketide biosynthesis
MVATPEPGGIAPIRPPSWSTLPAMSSSARISPTAHYTGYVWFRNGLSHPAFKTTTGQLLFAALEPANRASRALFGSSLEGGLLARHRVIDHLLERAIDAGEVSQVIEVAAGLSPRGRRFSQRYGERLLYIEGDLPGMAATKRGVLDRAGAGPRHHVVELDALSDHGPNSLATIAARELDPTAGTAIITEGLLNYFDRDAVMGMWQRFARVLAGSARGLYLSDLHLADEMRAVTGARTFTTLLSWFARGQVHAHFADAADAEAGLREAGFHEARAHLAGDFASTLAVAGPRDSAYVRVLAATVDGS